MAAQRATGVIRLATFNLMHGATADAKFFGDPEKVVEACVSLDADILALQEVDQGTLRTRGANLADMVAEATDMDMRFAKTMRMLGGQYGNALLLRGEITDVQTLTMKGAYRHRLGIGDHQFQFRRKPPRNAILATARLAAGEISVAATHLSIEHAVSRQQLVHVMATLACRQLPQVLMGDLNLSRSSVVKHPSMQTMDVVHGPPTFPVAQPKSFIDHIAVRGLVVQSVETAAFSISDHRALIADVVLA